MSREDIERVAVEMFHVAFSERARAEHRFVDMALPEGFKSLTANNQREFSALAKWHLDRLAASLPTQSPARLTGKVEG